MRRKNHLVVKCSVAAKGDGAEVECGWFIISFGRIGTFSDDIVLGW